MDKVEATLSVYFADENAYSSAPCIVDSYRLTIDEFLPATESAHNGLGIGDEAWLEFDDGTKIRAYPESEYEPVENDFAVPKTVYHDRFFQNALYESFPEDFPPDWETFVPHEHTALDEPWPEQSGAERQGDSLRVGNFDDLVEEAHRCEGNDYLLTLNAYPFVDFNLEGDGFLAGEPYEEREAFRLSAYIGIRVSGFEEHPDEGYAIAFNSDEPHPGYSTSDFAIPLDAEFEYWFECVW